MSGEGGHVKLVGYSRSIREDNFELNDRKDRALQDLKEELWCKGLGAGMRSLYIKNWERAGEHGADAGWGRAVGKEVRAAQPGGLLEGSGQEFKLYSGHTGEPFKDFKQGRNMVLFSPQRITLGTLG